MREQVVRLKQRKAIKNWTMTQMWEHLVFAHWPVSPEIVRKLVPDQLEIDTFGGTAWIGVIPFLMNGFKLKYIPVPYPFSFPEINIRTYVLVNGTPAIFFITLDAADPRVVHIAKRWYHLPYYNAKMSFKSKEGVFLFQSERKKPTHSVATFHGEFNPISDYFIPGEGTIEHWLTERYVFFSKAPGSDKIYGGKVFHEPWVLQTARGNISVNNMMQLYNIALPSTPQHLHYSRGVEALIGRVSIFDKDSDPSCQQYKNPLKYRGR